MQQNLTKQRSPWSGLRQLGMNILVVGLLLAVPALAIGFLGPWAFRSSSAAGATTSIAAGDDPIANGLRILEPPIAAAPTRLKGGLEKTPGTGKAEVEVLLNDWTYTDDRPRPSPGH